MFQGRNDTTLLSFSELSGEKYTKIKNLAIAIYNVKDGFLARIWSAGGELLPDYPTNILVHSDNLEWLRDDIKRHTPCDFYYYDYEWKELKEVWL